MADFAEAEVIAQALAPDGWHLVPPQLDQRDWRRLYVLAEGDRRAAHLHLVINDSRRAREQIVFRDALRADAALRDRYARLKWDLAARHPDDREAYTHAKAAFVRSVVDSAPS